MLVYSTYGLLPGEGRAIVNVMAASVMLSSPELSRVLQGTGVVLLGLLKQSILKLLTLVSRATSVRPQPLRQLVYWLMVWPERAGWFVFGIVLLCRVSLSR